jgi:gamma-glutamylcyclotransferase (GGCT)/AIG2-like uncharacterized protein YtfP
MPVLLFSYGTLQDTTVQTANFGRKLCGREDSLPGYSRRLIATAEAQYWNVEPSSDPKNEVSGTVFEVTESELAAADKYEEEADYCRIQVTLRSGAQAWVYTHNPKPSNPNL